ncbi:hypothetical protein EMGBD4_16110 [Verrucomicrobiota bacterium]|nr:hypothetical protein EMGBD4_16110 [Verrucomicrobiota bacterium]
MDLDGLIGADILFEKPFYMDLSNKFMTLGKTPDLRRARDFLLQPRRPLRREHRVEGQKVP